MIRVYFAADPAVTDNLMLCDDCAVRVEREWSPSRLPAPPGADCDACGAGQEAAAPSQTNPQQKDPR